MTNGDPYPTPEVRTTCPECEQAHRIVWPSDDRERVEIDCRPWCGARLTVTRDGSVVE